MVTVLLLFFCIGAATIGGVFFTFSTFVMKALAQLPASHGAAAMQRINVVVLNPLFLGTFMGTAVLGVGGAIHSILSWHAARSPLLLVAALLYVLGSFAVTIACNVPMNNRLARLEPASAEAAAYWPVYLRDWSRWNHVRTAASLASAAGSALAMRLT